MDKDDVETATVLSVAYFFGSAAPLADRPHAVRAENDWLLEQAEAAPDRLLPYFSVNPLSAAALPEAERCLALTRFRGLKLHLANSNVSLFDPTHVARLRDIFALVGEVRLPVVVHLRTDADSYCGSDVRQFVAEVLPPAAASTIQIAHAGGWGGYDDATAARRLARLRVRRPAGRSLGACPRFRVAL